MTTINSTKHQVNAENAGKFWEWLQTRGGLAIWESQDLSNPGQTWTTPLNGIAGQPSGPPSWKCSKTPIRVINDPADVEVCVDKEVKRFRVGIRRSSQGFSMKVTDAGSRRIHKEVEKAGQGAYYIFDYDTQEACIMAPDSVTPLTEFIKSAPAQNEQKDQ